MTMDTNRDTNVWRLYRIIESAPNEKDTMEQVLIWCPGVGMDPSEGTLDSALANNLRRNVRWAYDKLRKEYREGDEIILVGFSRGAWIMRAVSSIVGDIGLPNIADEQLAAVFKEYATHPDWDSESTLDGSKNRPKRCQKKCSRRDPARARQLAEQLRKESPHEVQIKSRTHLPESRFLGFPVEIIGSHVENTFHALACDDGRKLWNPTKAVLSEEAKALERVLKQCWFGGWHADIGGGWDSNENASIALTWMVANLQEFTGLRVCLTSLRAIPGGYSDPAKRDLKFIGNKSLPRSFVPASATSEPLRSTHHPAAKWGEYPAWGELLPKFVKRLGIGKTLRPPLSEGDTVHPNRVIQNAPTQEGDMEQVLIWCPGVGMSEGEKSLESLLGSNLRRNVRWAFDKLRKEYQPGDEIILCGFSRGAWIMRAVAAIVGDIGLPRLPEHQIDAVFDEYAAHPVWDKHASLSSNSNKPSGPSDKAKQARKMAEWCREEDPHRVEIKALVLFDTVGAIGGPWSHSHLSQSRFLGFPVEVIGSHVENTFHAVAADDRRKLFWPTRAELSDDAKEAGRVLKQCWFGGWHADVGGGWDATENSAITLTWMIANLQQCTTLRICRASLEAIPGGYTDPVKKGLTFEGSKKIPRSTISGVGVAAAREGVNEPLAD
ncbi:hypothetical protein MNV49_006893 [Pseudohyphozyma bogoriensis]|nr:hypothetical protein MNV49_006893 [Pseudohyphozyma bogoriensis]